MGSKLLAGYSNSLWTGNPKTKIWGPHYSKCKLIGKKTGTKSENLSPAKIEQTADLQRWFNDSMLLAAYSESDRRGSSGSLVVVVTVVVTFFHNDVSPQRSFYWAGFIFPG